MAKVDHSSITHKLYESVEKSLSIKAKQDTYKENIDKYMAANVDKYFIVGPGDRPIYSDVQINTYIQLCGLTPDAIKQALKESDKVGSGWNIMNNPFNTANVLATRYFAIKKKPEFIKLSEWYIIVSMYPSIHSKYFKYGVNEACMAYTINNLSDKYKIKQLKSLWAAMTDMIHTAYQLHEKNIIEGEDIAYVKYIQDVHTRLNSLIRNIANEYYANHDNRKYLETEFESFDEDNYHEADSNSYEIDRIANNVVNQLVIHGPDMKLVELSAKSANVSVNQLRTYTLTLINGKHRKDIWDITEALLFLYLFNDDGESHSVAQIRTNDFMLYCLKVYKRSNTTNKNVIKIKAILDRWIDEVGVKDETNRAPTIMNYKKALYTFFVFSIEKYGK